MIDSEALDAFRCPTCAGALGPGERRLSCSGCGASYPILGGTIPCVLPDAARRVEQWRTQLGACLVGADAAQKAVEAEQRKPGLLPSTAARLDDRHRATTSMRREIESLVTPLVGGPRAPSGPVVPFQSLANLQILFRDWGWKETRENDEALACVAGVLTAPLGRTLVIGAGGGRLAYDLHRLHGASSTLAIDIDPIYAAVAARVVAGGVVTLTEAAAGRSRAHELKAPAGPLERFTVALADGLAPPLRDGAFDTVVTPWFIDQIPGDVRDFCGVVRRVVAPGGRWLSFGPAVYPHERPAAYRFSFDEVLELAELAGFEVERELRRTLLYLESPLSPHARLEPCLAFSARKGDVPPRRDGSVPPWVVIPSLPVPPLAQPPAESIRSSAIRAILDLVDGSRSIDDIASTLAQRSGMNANDLKDSVRFALLEHHR